MDTQQYYLVAVDTGTLRFTARGRRELGRLFAYADIDLAQVRTLAAYQAAVIDVRRAVQGMTSRHFKESACRQVALAAFHASNEDRPS